MTHGQQYMTIAIVSIIIIGIDLYAFQGVRALTGGMAQGLLRSLALWAYWIISLALLANLFVAFGKMNATQQITSYEQWSLNLFLMFFLSKLTFIIVLFGEDIYRGIAGLVQRVFSSGEQTAFVPGRRKFIAQAGLALAAINFSSLLFGALKGKYLYKLHKHTLYFPDLPDAFDGFRIVQISDVHSGSFDNAEAVQRGIDLIKAQNADVFVFTGDIVNNKAEELEPWMDHFSQIRAPYGQFSVLGNHDYGHYVKWKSKEEETANLDKLKHLHNQLGYRLLLDENYTIEKDGQSISLLGVENWGEGFLTKGDLEKAIEGVPQERFKVLLSHDPTHWDAQVKNHKNKIHLTLSGHTHGMQMGVETPLFKFSPVQFRYKNWAGFAKENDRYLYVNRGFGFIGYSGRVGIWPEVAAIELRKGDGKLSDLV